MAGDLPKRKVINLPLWKKHTAFRAVQSPQQTQYAENPIFNTTGLTEAFAWESKQKFKLSLCMQWTIVQSISITNSLKKIIHYKIISLLAANELEQFPSNRPPPSTVKM